ncbi:MAG: hypothetical protein Q8N35_10025 [Methylococcaceae bacterium]|nr:hypothetical protein [Methylococcaceae bacterium]MDZ4155940.1 hypothetical protein [Methylococcales bacterium]MDP2392746.1 hypothetical protein [Methylococcaceae bacterium]MDP3019916.1 hypothetical protein [Methylococcaceae bacterium]MDP3389911.1 hypothetical protein [Methylococcaceae bacterium]
MQKISSTPHHNMNSLASLLVLPSIFFGAVLFFLHGISLINALIVLVMLGLSVGCGLFLWRWHINQLSQYKSVETFNELMGYTTELEKLLIMVTPKITEQVFAARELTELEISVLLHRFSAMLGELQQIIDFANNAAVNQSMLTIEDIKNNAEKIRAEIDVVLEALQFQDRVSQILTQAQDNLADLRKPAEKIHFQGYERNSNMIQVEELLAGIQKKYESVNQVSKRLLAENPTEELTYF